MSDRPLVKICGVTSVDDALAAVDLGADLLGLNFHPGSPRWLASGTAVEIARAVRERSAGEVRIVGVFVDLPRPHVEAIDAEVGLDLVQLHGDQGPEEVAVFGRRAIKVFRLAPAWESAAVTEPDLAADLALHPDAWGFLFDRRHESLYGGTGESWSWGRMAQLADPRPRLVAGGIRVANVRRALRESRATGVDVCSGVESKPGRKDHREMARLFAELTRMADETGGQ